jgi:HD-GYP domain-containing protein (c-di-GMP phosphodiesterase class II)
MRFVPSSCLKPGMVTGKNLYGLNNELMLAAGQKLTNVEILRINYLKFQGIYIEDKLSEDIEVEDIIDASLKNKAVKSIKDVFEQTKDGRPSKDCHLKETIEKIIDEIWVKPDVIYNMIDLKVFDDYTYYHSVNVFVLSVIIGISLGLKKDDLYNLGLGAILHDIGKVFIPKEIIYKNGKLTQEEFEIMKSHSEKGCMYLRKNWNVTMESTVGVLTHHEKYNGTGYPYKLKSDKIPEYGKIIAVSDVYDALISDRPYRKAIIPSEAMEYIMGGSGIYFDYEIVSAFFKKVMPFPVGTTVKLSNGLTGIVAENYSSNGLRPKIKIISENETESDCQFNDVYYDLYKDRSLLNVTIVKSLSM